MRAADGIYWRVLQDGTRFTVYDPEGKQITYFSSPNQELIGVGLDFFVLRQNNTFTTYDARCRRLSYFHRTQKK